jgi:hypothetical protein
MALKEMGAYIVFGQLVCAPTTVNKPWPAPTQNFRYTPSKTILKARLLT